MNFHPSHVLWVTSSINPLARSLPAAVLLFGHGRGCREDAQQLEAKRG